MMALPLFDTLSDDQLLAETRRLVSHEREATAALLRALVELDARRLYLREGCASLFTDCTEVLHLAEGAAYNRIEAARAARRYPVLLDALTEGSLTLTSIRLLAPHFTDESHRGLIAAARHKSKRELELLIATLRPKPPAPTVIRKLPTRESVREGDPKPDGPRPSPQPTSRGLVPERVAPPAPTVAAPASAARTTVPAPSPAASIGPLSADRYRLQVTISRETHDKLRRARICVVTRIRAAMSRRCSTAR